MKYLGGFFVTIFLEGIFFERQQQKGFLLVTFLSKLSDNGQAI